MNSIQVKLAIACWLILLCPAWGQDITSSLVAHWSLDDGSGTTVVDSTANGYDGTISGSPTWQTDAKIGGGLDFESSDGADSISAGTFDLTGTGVTLAAWIRWEDDGLDQRIITKSSSNVDTSTHYWQLNHDGISTDLRIVAGGSFSQLSVNTNLTPGYWYHLVGTYDGSTMRLYVDGVEVGSQFHGGGAVATSSLIPVTIGDSPVGSRAFDGQLDDLRVYDRALSATVVETLFKNGWGSKQVLLVTANFDTYTAQEQLRKKQFEDWDYYVTPIHSYSTQSLYDTALASVDVAYVSEELLSWAVDYKLREATVGVIVEERLLTDEFGFSTSYHAPSDTDTLNVVDTSHFITSPFSTGNLTFADSATDVAALDGTLAADVQVLGNWGSDAGLAVLETGATLANSYNGSDTAFGRRVALLLDEDFDWSELSADGLTIVERSLEWASEINNGLEGHWKLDETSGTTAADSSGSGNDGTLVGSPTWDNEGKINGALTLTRDGVDRVALPANVLDSAGDVTFATWFRTTNNAALQTLVSGANASNHNEFFLTIKSGTQVGFTGGENAGDDITWTLSTSFSDGKWHHLAIVRDDANNQSTLYFDGVSQGTLAHTLSTLQIDSGGLMLGEEQDSVGGSLNANEAFDGSLDEVYIFRSALTPEKIAELYGLVGHWKLDETSGPTATDSSGAGNDGTYVNSPTLGVSAVRKTGAEFSDAAGFDRLELPNTVLDGNTSSTVAWWMKTTKAGNNVVLSGANSSTDNSYILHFIDSTTFAAVIASTQETLTVDPVADGCWHHFAFTHVRSTGAAEIFIDGKSAGTLATPAYTGTYEISAGGLVVGEEQESIGGGFDSIQSLAGSLDDLRIYNRVLTPAEIVELYGLVGHWKLDEASGTVAADSSGSGFDGTHTGGVTVNAEGPYPGDGAVAAQFDGSNDYVDLPNMCVDFSSGFAAACWVKADTTPSSGQTQAFLELSNGAGVDEIWVGGVGTVGFQLYMSDTADGSSLRTIEDNTDLVAGKWTHYVASVDSSGNANLYRNGELVKSQFTSIPKSILRTQTSIATSPLNDFFPGSLDDVRLYNRPLSDKEIVELYGLVGHWKMDEGIGSTAADSSLLANDATLNGATWTTDCAGNNGLEFDGLGDTAATNSAFDPPAKGTVALWFRSDGPPASRQRPWGVGGDFEMWQDPDGLVSCDVSTDGYQGGFITDEPLHMDGRWYHLVAVYDSDDDSYSLYINGELHKSGISTWAMTKQAANTLTFGTRTGIAEYYDGAIRDFRIYNRPLSGSEISELSGLVGYWKLDETSGTLAVDSSALDNDGTYTNGVALNQGGNVDQAAGFDGMDDYVAVADDPSLQMDETFSLSAWIRADSSANVNQMIVNKEGEYELSLFPGGGLYWGVTNTDPGWSWHNTGHVVAIGKWTYVAMTYDNGTVSTYADGRLIDTYNGSGPIGDQYTALNELRIGGRSNNPPNKYFDGRIDDVRVFNRVLCPTEIFGQYKGGRPAGIRILKWVEVR